MRFAFFLLGLFFVFVSARARELTSQERLVLTPYETNTKNIKEYFEKNIDSSTLSWSEWFAYKGFVKSCDPLRIHILTIQKAKADYPDQTQALIPLYGLCTEGTLNLAKYYIKAQG